MIDLKYVNEMVDFWVIKNDPDPALREISKPVEVVDDQFKFFMRSLLKVMHKEGGMGIAAIQIGIPLRAFIVKVPDDHAEETFFMINPKIESLSKEKVVLPEGCLSVKTLENKTRKGEVERPKHITISYTDLDNNRKKLKVDGNESEYKMWLSRCIQHEYDHLDGILFIDKLYGVS